MSRQIRVKTASGKFIHSARRYDLGGRMRYIVLCNRVPRGHAFTETRQAVTCPHCISREA